MVLETCTLWSQMSSGLRRLYSQVLPKRLKLTLNTCPLFIKTDSPVMRKIPTVISQFTIKATIAAKMTLLTE